MKVIWKFIAILALGWTVQSCDMYNLEDTISEGVENMDFDCFDNTSDYYFRGIFGEDSICAYDGENGYRANLGLGNGFITLSPTFTLEELQSQESKSFVSFGIHKDGEDGHLIVEEIRLKSQPQKFGTPLDSMVRAFLVNGIHPVRGKVNDDSISTEGFEILLDKIYMNPSLNPDHWTITCTSSLGIQPPESFVNILDVSLIQNGDYIEGYIHLTFSCKLYLRNSGKLTGTFARDLSGEFNLPVRYKH